MNDKPAIISILKDAELAHEAGDFVNALSFYEHFFDHALDDDPYALYGVRLSHCLRGWTELATVFPGARNRLESKRREMLALFRQTRVAERFHDYLAISRHLGLEQDALAEFLALHEENPETAAQLAKYLWDDLISAEHWSVCNDLLEEPGLKLDELLAVFDEAARLKDYDPAFNNIKFEQHIVDVLLNDLQNLVLVLRSANRADDIAALQRQFQQALEIRGHSLLHAQAHAKGSFLFTGH